MTEADRTNITYKIHVFIFNLMECRVGHASKEFDPHRDDPSGDEGVSELIAKGLNRKRNKAYIRTRRCEGTLFIKNPHLAIGTPH